MIASILFIAFVPSSTIQYDTVWQQVAGATSHYHFDFVTWELNAIGAKADALLFGQSALMTEANRSQYVRDYMVDLSQLLSLEAQITAIYTDTNNDNPAQDTLSLRQQRDDLRESLKPRQATAESILEGHVATILLEEGFGTLGQLFPPMAMRFTQMPNLLVTSPRDQIRMENSLVLDPITIEQRIELEDAIFETFDVSAIIVPLGGIALYPAMVQETSNISFLIETFAHEWVHHYLYFHPLGLNYFAGEARIINETTADLFGREIASSVIERYYSELIPPTVPTASQTESQPLSLSVFDFASEMNTTRVGVDERLAIGDVEGAEAYMEERRLFFYENGYRLRRINQAFFAFYGGYQAGGGVTGAGGTDPIGPAVIQIREQSPSIYAFIQTMQQITTREQLLNTLAG